jgi:hypothetical protein
LKAIPGPIGTLEPNLPDDITQVVSSGFLFKSQKNMNTQEYSKQDVILRFWIEVVKLYGPLASSYKAKKAAAQRMLQCIDQQWQSQSATINCLKLDPEGALSLFFVTLYQASVDGWGVSTLPDISKATYPKLELSRESFFTKSDAIVFAMHAALKFNEALPMN